MFGALAIVWHFDGLNVQIAEKGLLLNGLSAAYKG